MSTINDVVKELREQILDLALRMRELEGMEELNNRLLLRHSHNRGLIEWRTTEGVAATFDPSSAIVSRETGGVSDALPQEELPFEL